MLFLKLKSKKGNAVAGLMAISGVLGLTLIFSQIQTFKIKSTYERVAATKGLVNIQNAIEMFLISWRMNLAHYYSSINGQMDGNPAGCTSPRSFLDALENGSNCSGINIKLFASSLPIAVDPYTDLNPNKNLYSYHHEDGCLVSDRESTCKASLGERLLVTIGHNNNDAQKINGVSYAIYLKAFLPEKGVGEFRLEYTDPSTGKTQSRLFAITNDIRDLVHLESDTRVTRDSIDPLNPCPNEKWGEFRFLDPATKQCTSFGYIGAGTGISQNNGRYFINRAIDGVIVDVGVAPSVSSKFSQLPGTMSTVQSSNNVTEVPENGMIGTTKRIPAYSRDLLIGVKDIDIVNDQIFYVQGQGPGAHIGLIKNTNGVLSKQTVCNLGGLNWAQAPKGIAAASWSDNLTPSIASTGGVGGVILGGSTTGGSTSQSAEPDRNKIAYFSIKTSSGDILNAFVIAIPNKGGALRCVVHRNNIASQDVENKRTTGITRAGESIPYWIY